MLSPKHRLGQPKSYVPSLTKLMFTGYMFTVNITYSMLTVGIYNIYTNILYMLWYMYYIQVSLDKSDYDKSDPR